MFEYSPKVGKKGLQWVSVGSIVVSVGNQEEHKAPGDQKTKTPRKN